MPGPDNEPLRCSFCGKSQQSVKKLVAGPGVYICDQCVDLCCEIFEDEGLRDPRKYKAEISPQAVLNDWIDSIDPQDATRIKWAKRSLEAQLAKLNRLTPSADT